MNAQSYNFIFQMYGTAGDVLPFIAIGKELITRGHTCTLLSNEPFEALAKASGMDFVAIAPRLDNQDIDEARHIATYLIPSYDRIMAFFQSGTFDPLHTIVINLHEIAGSNSVCELYNLKVCRMYLAPSSLQSTVSPAWPLGRTAAGLLGGTFRKYKLAKIYHQQLTDPLLVASINGQRKAWGLPAISSTLDLNGMVCKRMGLFPKWFSGYPSDWPAITLTNFPLPQSSGSLPIRFLKFVERAGAPLVFTPGTGVPNVERFFAAARECCEKLGLPGVFLSPHAKTSPNAYGNRILQFDYLDLGLALKYCVLLVHHGGIGTIARAIQAGIPQIISPFGYDQPNNAHRVTVLGVGAELPRAQLDGPTLAVLAGELLRDPYATQSLQQWGKQLRSIDAIGVCADTLVGLTSEDNRGG